ncbi:hypothetical protein DFP72DRAFT_479215 [Ephemerocybe angulata]|uniref:Uncharacterized protein n=1 Tax=Ephemerocybe angulata TaxID=980116 RepID=A0A8H6IEK3_9AGAR|nr:hypothetical protein DFP72DRAFT_479215 [Tulosesus angulatus]
MSRLGPLFVTEKPGHGKDVDWVPTPKPGEIRSLFPNALVDTGYDGGSLALITLRELTMLRFMNAVTDKLGWTDKVFNEEIIKKWEGEAVLEESNREEEMTKAMFDYCIKELQHRAANFDDSPRGGIQVFPGDVWKSDTAISEETRLALLRCVRPLEDVPEHKKDWHPGSDGKVLDLVHPSLFPLIYGTSRILPVGTAATTLEDCAQRCGEGEVIPIPGTPQPRIPRERWARYEPEEPIPYSTEFQWLPCEVDILGEKPRILTYINNLHPEHHPDLYTVVEDVIAAAIPLWERTLAPIQSEGGSRIPRRIPFTEAKYDPDPGSRSFGPAQEEGESHDAWYARLDVWSQWCEDTRRVVLPEPGEFEPLAAPDPLSLKELCAERPLQVIVKLANIELTPGKPEYEGGSWHVEGKMNESICASAIYYYSCENISPSSLSFRQQSQVPERGELDYPQYYHEWLPEVFGIDTETDSIQVLGSVDTREGRVITFPNILQHQVQPFKLEDPTKPGHRKIIALFLVDPHTNIISTADVPPQRLDWWAEEVPSKEGDVQDADALTKLPNELKQRIFSSVEDFPIDMETAKELREKLMAERKSYVLDNQGQFAATPISLCEH